MSKNYSKQGGNGVIYGLGLIGAAIYYIGHASGLVSCIIGFLKALVWPAFLVYELLKFLHTSPPV